MKICRVVGNVVGSQTADRLNGPTYLLVQPTTAAGAPKGSPIVAVDAVQAGEGDLVILSQGSSCRQIRDPETPDTVDTAVDALVIGVIDLIDSDGSVSYRAAETSAGAETGAGARSAP